MSNLKTRHKKEDVATNRPGYREARWERAVKVYTVNQESKYLLVQNVHALGVTEELMQLFALYGSIDEYRLLDEYPSEPYTDVYWVRFVDIDSARLAKKKTDNQSFFGKNLHVCYAPEYETVQETREKLQQRRKVIAAKTRDKSVMQSDKDVIQTHPSHHPTHSTRTGHIEVARCAVDPLSQPSEQHHHSNRTNIVDPSSQPVSPLMSYKDGLLMTGAYPSMLGDTVPFLTPDISQRNKKDRTSLKSSLGDSKEPSGLSKDARVCMYLSAIGDPVQPVTKEETVVSEGVHKPASVTNTTVRKRRRI